MGSFRLMMETENPGTEHPDLDRYSEQALVAAFVADQSRAAEAVHRAEQALARGVAAALPRIQNGGRLVYVGAGTSGRLGLLDAVELGPTFSWPAERAVPLLAGGPSAVYLAREGTEDDLPQGGADVRAAQIDKNDVVLLVTASGSTPYVLGACRAAREAGALTIGFANNRDAPLLTEAEVPVLLETGSEVISGSTRLKAGTAQKIALNTFSSALMVRLNKVYRNLMVDVRATNAKLRRRAVRLTALASGCPESAALPILEACGYSVAVAIVALSTCTDTAEAKRRLDTAGGSVREALGAQSGQAGKKG